MSVTSVFSRTGAVVAQAGDYSLAQLSDLSVTSPTTSQALLYNGSKWINTPLVFSVEAFGAVGNGIMDCTTNIQAAINAAAAVSVGGAWVEFHTGVYVITSRLTMPNRVSLRGQGRGSVIRAQQTNYSDTRMIVASNGTSSMFNSRIVDMNIDWNNNTVANSAVIESQAWQENCGLEHVLINNFNNYGVYLTHGYGSAYLKFSDIEIFGGNFSGTTGIRVDELSTVGGFILNLVGASITGYSNSQLMAYAVDLQNDSLVATGLHVEDVTTGVHTGGDGKITLIECSGSSSTVTNLCVLDSTFAGQITMIGCQRNGASVFIQNSVSGETITTDLPIYTYPAAYAPNTSKQWVTFAGSTGTVLESSGGVTVSRGGVGNYSVSWPTAFADTNYAYFVMHKAGTGTGNIALTQEYSKATNFVHLLTYSWSGSSGSSAALVDPAQVYVVAYAVK